jgi:hypothetical protein
MSCKPGCPCFRNEKKFTGFKITIGDSFTQFTYNLKICDNHSIREIAEALFKMYNLETPNEGE